MSIPVGTYRITLAMLEAGANAMRQCSQASGHTAHTACQAIFQAMLEAADIHPGADLRKSFAWSPHDTYRSLPRGCKPRKAPKAVQERGERKPGKLTRADFDANGVREIVTRDGAVHRQYLQNFWYIKDE